MENLGACMGNNLSTLKISTELIFKAMLLCLCGYGIAGDAIQGGEFNPYAFAFFTIISNSSAFIYLLVSLVMKAMCGGNHSKPVAPRVRGMIITALLLLTIVYWAMIASSSDAGLLSTPNLTIHLLVPILFLADWIFFDQKEKWSVVEPIRWSLMWFGYCLLVFAMATSGLTFQHNTSRFPYAFFDADVMGLGNVIIIMGIILVAFLIVGYGVVGLDRLFSKLEKITAVNHTK
jgi:hypothetical protein